ncbi:hypothetical protein [Maribacter sp. 4G9]|uniref:hypothetical protein n=1 Tax=Maribacter sp. 4G9 TaxID=1889777 RepID=UPI000C1556C0|nr:hypothetical protein [Maribacter sp. 4G9]PIB22964.1 hypothetical protein BFP75_10655 [Maribacter sp. 4G9]
MKSTIKLNCFSVTIIALLLFVGAEAYSQYGYGYGGYGGAYGYGRQRSAIPQAQEAPEEVKPKTAEELVDGEMPSIKEALQLNDFETAILSSILKKYVQERIEAQILKLPPEKMREVYDKITLRQDEELKASLPMEKYEAFVELQKNGVEKTIKKNKKQKKKQKKKN